MALVLCFHFQLGVLRGLNMSVVSERMSFESCSVSPSCNCQFIVYCIPDMWCVCVCVCADTGDVVCKYVSIHFEFFHWIFFTQCDSLYISNWERFLQAEVCVDWVCFCGLKLMSLSSCVPGQHRSLGPSISKVRSLKLDSSIWSNALVEVHTVCCFS